MSPEATRVAEDEPRVRHGVRAAAPIAVGPLLFGASFGLLAESAGMGPAAALVMSATTFAGSAQFAVASVLATGPVLLGRRQLPAWLAGPVAYLAPAVLAALVVTQSVGGHRELVADARLAGLGVGALAIMLRAPLLVVIVAAAAAAALVRLV